MYFLVISSTIYLSSLPDLSISFHHKKCHTALYLVVNITSWGGLDHTHFLSGPVYWVATGLYDLGSRTICYQGTHNMHITRGRDHLPEMWDMLWKR